MLVKYEEGLAMKTTDAACFFTELASKLREAIRVSCLKYVEDGPL